MLHTSTGQKRPSQNTHTEDYFISKRPAIHSEGDQGINFLLLIIHTWYPCSVCVCIVLQSSTQVFYYKTLAYILWYTFFEGGHFPEVDISSLYSSP